MLAFVCKYKLLHLIGYSLLPRQGVVDLIFENTLFDYRKHVRLHIRTGSPLTERTFIRRPIFLDQYCGYG